MNKNGYLCDLTGPGSVYARVPFDQQSAVQRVFSATIAMEGQVNNGGFAQYFSSSDAGTAPFAPEALRAIGALRCASIVERALQIGPRGDTSDLDNEFMAYPDNLAELLFNHVASHPETFGEVRGTE